MRITPVCSESYFLLHLLHYSQSSAVVKNERQRTYQLRRRGNASQSHDYKICISHRVSRGQTPLSSYVMQNMLRTDTHGYNCLYCMHNIHANGILSRVKCIQFSYYPFLLLDCNRWVRCYTPFYR